MIIYLIIIGIILCIISIIYLISEIKDNETVKDKFLALIDYVADPFAGSVLLYLGLLCIIAGFVL